MIHTDKKYYYVTAIDGAKRYTIAGPYASHETALSRVRGAMVEADKGNPRAWFMAWGTAGSDKTIKTPLGAEWTPA